MEERPRGLVIALVYVALVTSALLVLIDYKLKRDLLDMFRHIQEEIDRGQKLYRSPPDRDPDTDGVRTTDLVGNASPVEASNGDKPPSAPRVPEGDRAKATQRGRRTRDQTVFGPDNQVGP